MSLSVTTESRLALASASNGTCFEELVLGLAPFVADMARRHANGSGEQLRKELEAEGTVALCEAAVSFAHRKPTCRFVTFAGKRINRAMVSALRTAGPGTEYRARLQQEGRRGQKWLTDILGDPRSGDGPNAPSEFELAYAKDSRSIAKAARLQLSVVPIEDAHEHDLGMPPEVEDGAEYRYHARWLSLPKAQRILVEQAERLGSATNGVSLTQLSHIVGERRSVVERKLGDALQVLTFCSEDA